MFVLLRLVFWIYFGNTPEVGVWDYIFPPVRRIAFYRNSCGCATGSRNSNNGVVLRGKVLTFRYIASTLESRLYLCSRRVFERFLVREEFRWIVLHTVYLSAFCVLCRRCAL